MCPRRCDAGDEFGFAETHLRSISYSRGARCETLRGRQWRDYRCHGGSKLRQGVLLERCGRIMQRRARAPLCAIAGGANLEGNAPPRRRSMVLIVDGGDAVADALDAESD